jgi:transglutaminase-like putative cysteine protease
MMDAKAYLDGPGPDEVAGLVRRHGGRYVGAYDLPGGGQAFHLEFPDHASKVAFLDGLAELDAFTPWVRRAAEQIAAGAAGPVEQIARLHAYVRDRVAHTEEPIETFSPPRWVLESRIGDCDDTARALLALLRSLGHRGRLATLGHPPRHVAAQVQLGDDWHWLETTIPARAGEHPLEAAKRLGIVTRSDLG